MKPPAIYLPSYTARRDLACGLWALGFRFLFVEGATFDEAWMNHVGTEANAYTHDFLILQGGDSISVAYAEWVNVYHQGEYLTMNSPRQFLAYARRFTPVQEAI